MTSIYLLAVGVVSGLVICFSVTLAGAAAESALLAYGSGGFAGLCVAVTRLTRKGDARN